MRQVNCLTEDELYDDSGNPVCVVSGGNFSEFHDPNPREFYQGSLGTSLQVSEDTFLMRRYGLRSVKNPTRMVVGENGRLMETIGLTAKIHCVHLWKSRKGAEGFSAALEKAKGIKTEVFVLNTTHVIGEV